MDETGDRKMPGKQELIKCEHIEKEMEYTDERLFIHIGNNRTVVVCELCKARIVEKLIIDLLRGIMPDIMKILRKES